MKPKILFLCGSLEPGKDGVGDYVRRLAESCAAQGTPCAAAALSDAFLGDKILRETEALPALRIGRQAGAPAAAQALADFQQTQQAALASLQFVPFAFHPRGLPFGLGQSLLRQRSLTAWHIMFHELWVRGPQFKMRVLGALQEWLVRRLARQLRPRLLHTSNANYQARLRQIGLDARVLPLFGNIPVGDACAETWLAGKLRESGVPAPPDWRQRYGIFVIFGTLHPAWQPEPLLSRLHAAAAQAGKQILLLTLGRSASGHELPQLIRRDYAGKILFLELGPQPAETVSSVLNTADFGLACSPLALLGKSGAAMAMLEHALPMIVSRDDIPGPADAEFAAHPLVLRLDDQLESRLLQPTPRGPRHSRLPHVAQQFLRDLRLAS